MPKRRVAEIIVQRPGDALSNSNGKSNSRNGSSYSNGRSSNAQVSSNGSSGLSSEVVSQLRSLISQGCNIGIEHANKRRF